MKRWGRGTRKIIESKMRIDEEYKKSVGIIIDDAKTIAEHDLKTAKHKLLDLRKTPLYKSLNGEERDTLDNLILEAIEVRRRHDFNEIAETIEERIKELWKRHQKTGS